MTPQPKVAIVPGDGIGPEVIAAAEKVLDAAQQRFNFSLDTKTFTAGANHYLETGELFTDIAAELRDYDAILFGAMGDPRVTPGVLERGFILEMRKQFRQAANVRPVRLYPGVPTPIAGLQPEQCDIVFVRENTEGAYISEGLTAHRGTPEEVAIQESVNTRQAIARVVEYAFRLAQKRRKKLTLCHKTNVLVAAGSLWSRVVEEIGKAYPDVETDYVHVDAMCFHLPLNPGRFDVVVTDNLFGDIVTDLGAVIQGGLGVSTSANLNLDGSAPSMFEAIHGSAPDIAGKQLANPAGATLALALLLGHLGYGEAAAAIESATVAELGSLPALAGTEMGATTAQIGDSIASRVIRGNASPLPHSLLQTLAELRTPDTVKTGA